MTARHRKRRLQARLKIDESRLLRAMVRRLRSNVHAAWHALSNGIKALDQRQAREFGALADAAKGAADRAIESIDETANVVAQSNNRIRDLENRK